MEMFFFYDTTRNMGAPGALSLPEARVIEAMCRAYDPAFHFGPPLVVMLGETRAITLAWFFAPEYIDVAVGLVELTNQDTEAMSELFERGELPREYP